MGTPNTTARQTPTGVKLTDGYQTLITFADKPTISFWEKTVQPPGFDGGAAVDNTTMHNETVRTFAPRNLITMTDCAATCAYDAIVLPQILGLINAEDDVTITFPSGDTWAFFGFCRSFEPQDHEDGSQPEANIVVVCTNTDPTDGTEALPDLTADAGTGSY